MNSVYFNPIYVETIVNFLYQKRKMKIVSADRRRNEGSVRVGKKKSQKKDLLLPATMKMNFKEFCVGCKYCYTTEVACIIGNLKGKQYSCSKLQMCSRAYELGRQRGNDETVKEVAKK